MLADHHLHLEDRKGNGNGFHFQNPIDYLSCGRKKGVECFGFSDHAYIFSEAREINSNKWQQDRCRYVIDEYINTVKSIAENDEKIMVGLEVDYFPEKEQQIKKFIQTMSQKIQIDFFIGSVHWIGDWGFDLDENQYQKEMEKRGVEKVYGEYFEILEKAVNSRSFNIIGHIDLIKLFGTFPVSEKYIRKIVEVLKKNDQVIEINTNGKNKTANDFYPSINFLKECQKNNIDITLGSDAHSPDRVGEYFGEAVCMLQDVGYRKIVYFQKGKKKYINI